MFLKYASENRKRVHKVKYDSKIKLCFWKTKKEILVTK